MIRWFKRRYDANRRKIDIDMLWPECKKVARGDLEKARQAFRLHTSLDDAWTNLSDEEIDQIVEGLK